MKNIKVYLQYPWKFPDSPYYKYLINSPPEKIEYLNTKKQKGVITNKSKFLFFNLLKKFIRNSITSFRLSFPNAHLSPGGNYDLIHCAHCLSKNKKKLWISDFESEWQLYVGEKNNYSKRKVRKFLTSKQCKKILPWTEHTKKEIISQFPEIKNKIEVVFPAIPLQKLNKKKNKKIKILYATRYFWLKGGIIALEVYGKIKKKFQDKVELVFISDVPEEIKKNYPELEIRDLVSQKELFEEYSTSDLFFYPSFMDTFGFGLLEAMSFGLPIISVNTSRTKTRHEIIQDEKQGFVLEVGKNLTQKVLNQKGDLKIGEEEKELIEKLFQKTSELIKNKKLKEKMSKNCIKLIKGGKFSIKERNEKLKRVYEEAIK